MKVLVVSSYPEKEEVHGKNVVGVATYTKNTLNAIKSYNNDIDFEVFAEIFDNTDSYIDTDIQVHRVWKRGSFGSIFTLFTNVIKRKERDLLISFEMFMFGDFPCTFVSALMMGLSALMGKKITLILHQVVTNVSVFEKNPFKRFIFSILSRVFYPYLVFISRNVVVFEEALSVKLGNSRKINVIPLPVYPVEIMDRFDACAALDLDPDKKHVMCFGFIAEYKGIDDLISQWDPDSSQFSLIIAGGKNPNHAGDTEYDAYVENLSNSAREKNILCPGFIPEDKIKVYFSAADILVFPYKIFMSSSGPLAMAFSSHKPFILSSPLEKYFSSNDMKSTLEEVQLKKEDMLFDFTDVSANLSQQLSHIMTNYEGYVEFSRRMENKRNIVNVAVLYAKVLNK